VDSIARFVVFVSIAIVVVPLIMRSLLQTRNGLSTTYRQLALRFRGRYLSAGLWSGPSVRFNHGASSVQLNTHTTSERNSHHYTQVRISWLDRRFRCEVYPASLLSRVGSSLGLRDVEIGSPNFDTNFVISGNDPESVRKFLTPTVQASINELRAFGFRYRMFGAYGSYSAPTSGDIYIAVSDGTLLIKKLGYTKDYEYLERFVLLSLELYDQATTRSTQGIPHSEGELSQSEDYSQEL
jgi:Protein of unknown function (DUF3137)